MIFFQLVDDERQVRVLYIARGVGKHEVVDDSWVQAKYGIPAGAYVDYATMRGDASDGLPGISGIGDKTAASLLNSYGDLEGILAAASGSKPKISSAIAAKLGAAIDYLAVAPTVVAVVRDLDLGVSFDDLRCPTTPAKPELFAELTELLGTGRQRRAHPGQPGQRPIGRCVPWSGTQLGELTARALSS